LVHRSHLGFESDGPQWQISGLAVLIWSIPQDRTAQLSATAAQHFDDLGDLFALVLLVAAGDGVFDAMADVIAQDFFFGATQGRPHRRNLGEDVDTIAAVLNHAGQATNLAFYAFEPFQHGSLCVFLHT
jgi:hypothetical protein